MTVSERRFDSQQPFEVKEGLSPEGISMGIYLPQNVLTNNDIEKWQHVNGGNVIDVKGRHITAEGLVKRTGIEMRHIADPSETTAFMGEQAAKLALNGNRDIYGVFFSSSYPVGFNQATKLAQDLGLSRSHGNVEIGAACSGFVRGLTYIKQRERIFEGRRLLFVASERYSDTVADLRQIEPHEESTQAQFIFSDGATAMEFTYEEDIRVVDYINRKIASNDIGMPIDRGKRAGLYIEETVPYAPFFRQDGEKVLKTVTNEVPIIIDELLKRRELTPDDIKFVIPHQPSRHLLSSLSRRSSARDLTFIADIRSGNFSSASIPKALAAVMRGDEMEAYRGGKLIEPQQYKIDPGDKVILAGFGAGFFASVALVEFA